MKNDKVTSHPSFGGIRLSRVQSTGAPLFGSATLHSHYVMLDLYEADSLDSELTGHHAYPKRQIASVALSESQFAEFISSWNIGEPTPCTLMRRPDTDFKLTSHQAPMPEKSHRETFEDVIDQGVKSVQDEINKWADEIEAMTKGRLTKKDAERMRVVLSCLRQNPEASLRFAHDRLNEGMEKMAARAKLEIEAAGRALLGRLGLNKAGDEVKKLLSGFEEQKPEAKDEVCPSCNGRPESYFDHEIVTCPKCKGTGKAT